MPAQILVVDTVATNRILLKVKLGALHYAVTLAATIEEAERHLRDNPPDLVLCALHHPETAMLSVVGRLRRAAGPASVPLLALGAVAGPDTRIACLAAGADDILAVPLQDVVLFARIRALLRTRTSPGEARLQRELERCLGLAEEDEAFAAAPRIVLAASGGQRREALARALPGHPRAYELRDLLGAVARDSEADLVVIDAASLPEARIVSEAFRMLVELRSRDRSRRSAQLLVLPDNAEELAAQALDLGADDLVHASVTAKELRLRAQRLLARKRRQDTVRDSLHDGLRAAVTDPLTGLYNRRYALPQLERLARQQAAAGRPFAVLLLDLDHFKRVNDRCGHGAGDRVLVEVADRLRGALDTSDLAARIGGEEFLVVLPETGAESACSTARRLCRLIEATPFSGAGDLALTVSIGIALGGSAGTPPQSPKALLARADGALYEAKQAGRNRVSLSAA